MFFFDPLFLILSLPALILGLWAQAKVRSAFDKYSKIRSWSGMTGAEAARRILDSNGLHNIQVEQTGGFLSDNYDPRKKVLHLSPNVYQSNSLASVGVAAHEAGHALQDKQGYAALQVRPVRQLAWSNCVYCRIFLVAVYSQPVRILRFMGWCVLVCCDCPLCLDYFTRGI